MATGWLSDRWQRVLAGCTLVLLMSQAGSSRAAGEAPFDVVIRGGTVYDGSGTPGRRADVGVCGDRITAVGDLTNAPAASVVDATGLAVAPGFINMLSWSTESLIVDGRGLSELRQGVTTQVFGEGWSMGPLNDRMKRRLRDEQADIGFEIEWTTLAEYLLYLEKRGVSHNVASFVGATTIREYVIGLDDKQPTTQQLDEMRRLTRQAMQEGALGVGSSLIYAPASYARTEELIELCKVAAEYGGMYISHLRSEADRLEEGVAELIRISREAGIAAEIYHLKAAGQANWPKLARVVKMVEAARASGLRITANMYTYPAGATGLDASLPPWALDGGFEALFRRLADQKERARIAEAARNPTGGWESLYKAAGSPDRIVLAGFKQARLKPLTGKTLAEVARLRGKDPIETILDLILEDRSRVSAVYFLMSEENIRRQVALPWMAFGSDEASQAAEGVFLAANAHPRAYGNFARLLGRYVREEKLLTLEEAVRRLTSFPASNLGLADRGLLRQGMFADIVVFDPATVADRATFERPHQYAVGVRDVWVNGVQVLKNGEHTGRHGGRALRRGERP